VPFYGHMRNKFYDRASLLRSGIVVISRDVSFTAQNSLFCVICVGCLVLELGSFLGWFRGLNFRSFQERGDEELFVLVSETPTIRGVCHRILRVDDRHFFVFDLPSRLFTAGQESFLSAQHQDAGHSRNHTDADAN